MSRAGLAAARLVLPLTDTVMLSCTRCAPTMHLCPGRVVAPGIAVAMPDHHGGGSTPTVTHVPSGLKIVSACCLPGAMHAAWALADAEDGFRWTSLRRTLKRKQAAVKTACRAATGVDIGGQFRCVRCG